MSNKRKHLNTENENESNIRAIGANKRLNTQDVKSFKAKSENQGEFLRLFYQNVPIISLHGWAGTGKTYIALAAAMQEAFDTSTVYEKITIIRSAVEVRKKGFLPGTEEEKMAVYERPYESIFRELLPFKDGYKHAKALGQVEFISSSFLRGDTFNDQIVIVDEAENMDYAELSTIMTRVGVNCRMIFIGDDRQTDLTRHREISGFNQLRKVLNEMNQNIVGMVDFTQDDIVRSEIVKQFLIAESRI